MAPKKSSSKRSANTDPNKKKRVRTFRVPKAPLRENDTGLIRHTHVKKLYRRWVSEKPEIRKRIGYGALKEIALELERVIRHVINQGVENATLAKRSTLFDVDLTHSHIPQASDLVY